LIAISLMRLLNRTEAEVFREHWKGSIDLKDLVTSISTAAEYFLPSKIKNVLRGRIERPSAEAA